MSQENIVGKSSLAADRPNDPTVASAATGLATTVETKSETKPRRKRKIAATESPFCHAAKTGPNAIDNGFQKPPKSTKHASQPLRYQATAMHIFESAVTASESLAPTFKSAVDGRPPLPMGRPLLAPPQLTTSICSPPTMSILHPPTLRASSLSNGRPLLAPPRLGVLHCKQGSFAFSTNVILSPKTPLPQENAFSAHFGSCIERPYMPFGYQTAARLHSNLRVSLPAWPIQDPTRRPLTTFHPRSSRPRLLTSLH
ncbi:MAG: hypothetical protein SGARI_006340 [Bacillariaceae sp.]